MSESASPLREGGGHGYNRVFEAYAGSAGDDLIGLVAYALYKRQKRDWLIRYRQEYAREPGQAEIEALTGGYLTEDLHRTLRDRAQVILNDYSEVFVEAAGPQIRESALAHETLRQARAIEQSIRTNSGFRRQVATAILSTALWSFLVAAVVLAAVLFGSDLASAWRSLVDLSQE